MSGEGVWYLVVSAASRATPASPTPVQAFRCASEALLELPLCVQGFVRKPLYFGEQGNELRAGESFRLIGKGNHTAQAAPITAPRQRAQCASECLSFSDRPSICRWRPFSLSIYQFLYVSVHLCLCLC